MEWSDAIHEHIASLKPVNADQSLYRRLFSLIDLTSLNDTDTESSIATFCEKARGPLGYVAGVCVYPRFLRLVATQFANSPIQAVTVVNFPEGSSSLDDVMIEIGRALEDGAQEIDVVFPYLRYLSGEQKYAHTFVEACKAACGDTVLLKVILETGVLKDPSIIADAAFDALTSGADFVKTSTGKIPEGATLEAAAVMLMVIQHLQPKLNRPLGCKVSGGIQHIQQAAQYVELADRILGRTAIMPDTFRIGASKLVDELVV